MKLKGIATAVLLTFVAASVLFLVVKEHRRDVASNGSANDDAGRIERTSAAVNGGATGERATTDETSGGTDAIRNGMIAYYFHTTRRCPTCRKLEAYTNEAIASGFADDLKHERLVWRVINTDAPENEHYIREYSLTTKSVVLVAVDDGKEVRWKNLSRIWELVGDKAAFINYVQGEVKDFQAGR